MANFLRFECPGRARKGSKLCTSLPDFVGHWVLYHGENRLDKVQKQLGWVQVVKGLESHTHAERACRANGKSRRQRPIKVPTGNFALSDDAADYDDERRRWRRRPQKSALESLSQNHLWAPWHLDCQMA